MTVTVYSKAGCVPCLRTKNALKNWGVEFKEKRIDLDAAALSRVQELGFQSVPVIEVEGVAAFNNLSPEDLKNTLAALGLCK